MYNYKNDGMYDMGQDGLTNAAGNFISNAAANTADYGINSYTYGSNTNVADAYGYSLNYYNNDYNRIDATANNPFASIAMKIPTSDASNPYSAEQLFNGNIGAMVVSMPKLGRANVYGYNYDQLNRLVNMNVFNGLNVNTNQFTPYAIDDYKESISYDANGNILTYNRNGHNNPSQYGPAQLGMDKLTYKYETDGTGNLNPTSNRLRYVHDQVAATNYAEDIDSQTPLTLSGVDNDNPVGFNSTDNYAYDAIGNLIKDTKEGITNIEWTVYGKISSITKADATGAITTISYTYDASGNRISKSVIPPSGVASLTYYVRDASGNVMSVYSVIPPSGGGPVPIPSGGAALTQTEIHLYGSSRLGVYNVSVNVQTPSRIFITMPGAADAELLTFARGNKFFELSNHLGNVLVTITDKKLAIDADGNGLADYYTADVATANDYYPFGMTMPGRKYSQANSGYRYGFNGKEQDKETTGTSTYDYGFRIYNPALGRFLSVDPLTKGYPMLTPYQFASNCPISGVDLDGLEFYYAADGSYLGQSKKSGTQLRIATKYEVLKDGTSVIHSFKEYKTNSEVSRLGRNESGSFTGVRSLSNDDVGRILAYGNRVFDEKIKEDASKYETVFDESIGRRDQNGDYGLLDFKVVA